MTQSLHSRYDVFNSNKAWCLILMSMKSLGWAKNLTGITGSHPSAERFQQFRRECLSNGDTALLWGQHRPVHTKGFAQRAMRHSTTTICRAGYGAGEARPLLQVLWLPLTATAAGGGWSVPPCRDTKGSAVPILMWLRWGSWRPCYVIP